ERLGDALTKAAAVLACGGAAPSMCMRSDLSWSPLAAEHVQLADATQCVTPERTQRDSVDGMDCLGRQNVLPKRAAKAGEPAGEVDGWADHCEIEPILSTDIPVDNFAEVQRHGVADLRKIKSVATVIDGTHQLGRPHRAAQGAAHGLTVGRARVGHEHCEHRVADELWDLTT